MQFLEIFKDFKDYCKTLSVSVSYRQRLIKLRIAMEVQDLMDYFDLDVKSNEEKFECLCREFYYFHTFKGYSLDEISSAAAELLRNHIDDLLKINTRKIIRENL